MINATMISSMTDELKKIAAPRWKVLMRQGQLDPSDVSRLTGANVLDYGREIAGLRKGTEEIARKKGIKVNVADWAGLKSGIQDWRAGRGTGKLKDVLRTGAMAAQGGGGLALPATNEVFLAPGISRLLMAKGRGVKGKSREGLDALIARHEIDEIGSGRKMLENLTPGSLPHVFTPGKDPKSILQKLQAKGLDYQRDLVHRLTGKMDNPQARDFIRFAAESQMPVRRGALPAGRHMSPEVIMRESRNAATLPSRVGELMRPWRQGEVETMGPGFQYGLETARKARQRILGAFGRGEI